MRRLEHCNIVKLKYFFYSSGEKVRPKGSFERQKRVMMKRCGRCSSVVFVAFVLLLCRMEVDAFLWGALAALANNGSEDTVEPTSGGGKLSHYQLKRRRERRSWCSKTQRNPAIIARWLN